MKKSIKVALLLIVFIVSILALIYELNTKKEYKGVPISFCEVCQEKYKDSIVEVEGAVYLFDNSLVVLGNYDIGLANSCKTPKELRTASIKIAGSDNPNENEMQTLEDNYSNEDLKIIGNNKEEIKIGDKVKVTGNVSTDKWSCSITVYKIEKIN
ncbi:MAG: hypothetical protein HC854_16630 [Flavobacterium sp.]|nr:hypothetical protein [Flavobacterium sp.]